MQLGLDTNSYRLATGLYEYRPARPLALRGLLAKAEELGLEGVHIANPRLLESTEPTYVAELRREAQQRNLYLELGAQGTDATRLREAIQVAIALGCSIVRTFVGADRQSGWAAWRQQLDRAVEGLKQVVPFAKDGGVRVAVENHGDLTSPELVTLLDKVDSEWVGACLDTGKPLLVVEDPLVAAQNLAPYLITACLTDYRLVPTPTGARIVGCALGEGVVHFLPIVELLRERRPDLHLNIEAPVQAWDLPFLQDKFWDAFYDRGPRDLAAIIRLLREATLEPQTESPAPPPLGGPEEAVLQHEEEMVRRSIVHARHLLAA